MRCRLALASWTRILSCLLLLFFSTMAMGQDSLYLKKADTIKHHNPRLATRYSLMLPGLGQAYNKQYWKIPIVYGILAIPASTFIYNNNMYQKTKFAYEAKFKASNGDPSDLAKIDPALTNLSIGSLQSYRNIFRKDRDFSVLWFILGWGLNIADASVSGHLKEFDISSNLAMRIRPTVQPNTQQTGFSLQLHFKNTHGK
ncbi:MAG: hypothetical protein RLZ56_982 [Bacteroidota bacterium]|jgi:hypothetical protein